MKRWKNILGGPPWAVSWYVCKIYVVHIFILREFKNSNVNSYIYVGKSFFFWEGIGYWMLCQPICIIICSLSVVDLVVGKQLHVGSSYRSIF
jgi:hypothetical protein